MSTRTSATPELLRTLWMPSLQHAAKMSFVASGQVATPSSFSPQDAHNPPPYLLAFLQDAFSKELARNRDLSPELPETNLSVDLVAAVLSTTPPFLLPKPFATAVISHAALSTTRIVPESQVFPPSYAFEVADARTTATIMHSVGTVLSATFLKSLSPLAEKQIEFLTTEVAKTTSLDDCLADYEGQGDTPKRQKHVHHARRVMDANILHDLLALGDNWDVEALFQTFDEVSGNDEPDKHISHASSVALISLGQFLREPNEHEIRLVNQNSRHLGFKNRVFVDFRSLSAAAPLVVTAVLRRYDAATTCVRNAEFASDVQALDNESVESLDVVGLMRRRLNREFTKMNATRVLAEDETFRTLNHLRTTLLKISNGFEQQRIKNFIKDHDAFNEHQATNVGTLATVCEKQQTRLGAFKEATLDKLRANAQTEILLVKEFRKSAKECVGSFNGELEELLRETEKIFLKSVEFHSKLGEDVVATFENHAYKQNSESLFKAAEKLVADSLESVKARTAENAAKFAEQEIAYKTSAEAANVKLAKALSEAAKSVFEEVELQLAEVSEATKERLNKIDEEMEDAKLKSHKIMANAELEVSAKAKEDVEAAAKMGGQDRFSAVSAKLNNDSTGLIMQGATDAATKLFDDVTASTTKIEEEVNGIAQKLPERITLLIRSLDDKLDGIRVEEKARCDSAAAEIAGALSRYVSMQETMITSAGEAALAAVKGLFSDNFAVVEREEKEMIAKIEAKVVENHMAEVASFGECKQRMLEWSKNANKEGAASSDRIFESVLVRSDKASEDEMQFLVTCHDALTTLGSERVGLLKDDYNSQVDSQVEEALDFSGEQATTMVACSNERSVRMLLASMVHQVESLGVGEESYKELLEKEAVQDDAIASKEEVLRKEFTEKMEATFKAQENKKRRNTDTALVNTQSVCSSLNNDAKKKSDLSKSMSEGASLQMQEMEKVAAARRKSLFFELQEKRRAEAENMIEQGYTKMAPLDLKAWSARLEEDMKARGGMNENADNWMVLRFKGENFSHSNESSLVGWSGPTRNFFVVLFGFDQDTEEKMELGRTEIVVDTESPNFEKLLKVSKHSHDCSRMTVGLYSADLKNSSEAVEDHTRLDEHEFTYEQFVKTSRCEMQFPLSDGLLSVEGWTARKRDLDQDKALESKGLLVLGKIDGVVGKKDARTLRMEEAPAVSKEFVETVFKGALEQWEEAQLENARVEASKRSRARNHTVGHKGVGMVRWRASEAGVRASEAGVRAKRASKKGCRSANTHRASSFLQRWRRWRRSRSWRKQRRVGGIGFTPWGTAQPAMLLGPWSRRKLRKNRRRRRRWAGGPERTQ
jgi:hypothetical protein